MFLVPQTINWEELAPPNHATFLLYLSYWLKASFDLCILGFLPRVRCEDWYHCHVCTANMTLLPAACLLRLASRLETRGNQSVKTSRCSFTHCNDTYPPWRVVFTLHYTSLYRSNKLNMQLRINHAAWEWYQSWLSARKQISILV